MNSRRVRSLILSNAFADTSAFSSMPNAKAYKFMPAFVMKAMILRHFPKGDIESEVCDTHIGRCASLCTGLCALVVNLVNLECADRCAYNLAWYAVAAPHTPHTPTLNTFPGSPAHFVFSGRQQHRFRGGEAGHNQAGSACGTVDAEYPAGLRRPTAHQRPRDQGVCRRVMA